MTKTNTGAGNRPQTIYRTAHDKDNPYVVITSKLTNDNTISLEARGLMQIILDKPDDWEIVPHKLAEDGNCGISKIRRILKELIKAGYIKKTIIRDQGKYAKHRYTIYELPLCENPQVDKPQVEKPQVENRTQISNEVNKYSQETNNHQQNNQSVCQSVLITTTTNTPPPPKPTTTTDNNQNLIDLFVVEIGRPPTDEENYLLSKRPLEWWQDAFDNKTKAIRSPIGFMQACINRNPKIITPVFENHTLSGEWADRIKT